MSAQRGKFKRGDIVEFSEDYNIWARKGEIGIVTSVDFMLPGQKDDLVSVDLILPATADDSEIKTSSTCYAYRLQKLGELANV